MSLHHRFVSMVDFQEPMIAETVKKSSSMSAGWVSQNINHGQLDGILQKMEQFTQLIGLRGKWQENPIEIMGKSGWFPVKMFPIIQPIDSPQKDPNVCDFLGLSCNLDTSFVTSREPPLGPPRTYSIYENPQAQGGTLR